MRVATPLVSKWLMSVFPTETAAGVATPAHEGMTTTAGNGRHPPA